MEEMLEISFWELNHLMTQAECLSGTQKFHNPITKLYENTIHP